MSTTQRINGILNSYDQGVITAEEALNDIRIITGSKENVEQEAHTNHADLGNMVQRGVSIPPAF